VLKAIAQKQQIKSVRQKDLIEDLTDGIAEWT
jgi:hypothetical protein